MNDLNDLNDLKLIENILRGDTEAFGVLVGRYSERVFALVSRIAGSREDAEEITQDAFVKAYGNLRKFRKESSFSSWIYRIAYNTAVSHLRKNRGIRLSELHDDRQYVEEDQAFGTREEQLLCLEAALEKLPPGDRALLTLFYQEEKTVREIARIVGQTENNIKIRLHRIRKRLAIFYEKNG